MSRSHKLAWVAGFFDGEGYITIEKRITKDKDGENRVPYHSFKIGINHVAPEPIDEVVSILGGNVRYDAKVKGNRKPRYSWTMPPQKSKEALIKMLPYLVNKKRAAILGLEFQDLMERGHKKTLTVEEVAERDVYRSTLQLLNSLS